MNTHTMNGFDPSSRRLARFVAFAALAQIALLGAFSGALAANSPKPAAPPATAPVAPPPSPKAVALAFVAALDKGDAPVAKSFLPDDKTHAKWVDASIALSASLKKLDAAALAHFNEAGKTVSQNQLHLADSFKSLESAQEKIDGDTATLTLPDRPQPLRLARVAGKWQLQIGPSETDAPRQIALYSRLTQVASSTAQEIDAGAYATADAAAKAFAARVLEARLRI
jgi:hypothetical protein